MSKRIPIYYRTGETVSREYARVGLMFMILFVIVPPIMCMALAMIHGG